MAIQLYGGKILTADGKVASHEDCCCTVPCTACLNSQAAEQYQVTITGVINAACTDCATIWNDTFILDLYSGFCIFQYVFATSCTFLGTTGPYVLLYLQAGWSIKVVLNYASGGFGATFQKNYASALDCLNLNNENIPYVSLGWDQVCNVSSPTCHVTAL